MKKINLSLYQERKVGEAVTGAAMIKAVQPPRKTNGARQSYFLPVTITDGDNSISFNLWNWPEKAALPDIGDIVYIEGKVSDYQGTKQLAVDKFQKTNNVDKSLFIPRGDFNIDLCWGKAIDLISEIDDNYYRTLCTQILEEYRDLWLTIPGALTVHHDYLAGTLQHSINTALCALEIAKFYSSNTHYIINRDLVIAGALLHDLGKLETYKITNCQTEMTDVGQILDHTLLGVLKLADYSTYAHQQGCFSKLRLLQHCIAAHHGKLEYGAPVTPKCAEAVIINYADGIDAKLQTLYQECSKVPAEAKFTGRVFSFNNYPVLTQNFVHQVMKGDAKLDE